MGEYEGNDSLIREILIQILEERLSRYLYDVLSNMLAIDFEERNIDQLQPIRRHARICAKRILRYVEKRNFKNSKKFSDALTLFSIAIADDEEEDLVADDQEILQSINQMQSIIESSLAKGLGKSLAPFVVPSTKINKERYQQKLQNSANKSGCNINFKKPIN